MLLLLLLLLFFNKRIKAPECQNQLVQSFLSYVVVVVVVVVAVVVVFLTNESKPLSVKIS